MVWEIGLLSASALGRSADVLCMGHGFLGARREKSYYNGIMMIRLNELFAIGNPCLVMSAEEGVWYAEGQVQESSLSMPSVDGGS